MASKYINKKNISIIRDEFYYLNSKGKQDKVKPKTVLGGFYYLWVVYEQITYRQSTFVKPEYISLDTFDLMVLKQTLRDKALANILSQINKRGKHD